MGSSPKDHRLIVNGLLRLTRTERLGGIFPISTVPGRRLPRATSAGDAPAAGIASWRIFSSTQTPTKRAGWRYRWPR